MELSTQDIRCSKIQAGIKQLKAELQIELVANILEVEENLRSKESLNQLIRIERATDQYLKRTNNLFYIGFLGHFSSGKSSTINSLLRLKGTKEEKKTAHNPTDDQITLISDLKNNPDVIKMTRSGKVPVIIVNIEGNSFLDDKVIMDTPGSGDPSTYEEIIRDSLPLCDLIIYCMAATHPFTNSDIPLLTEKEKNLSNIPTIYLITRANEFKENALRGLDEENFNVLRYQAFLAELSARIKNVVPTIDLGIESFLHIDNLENYRIEVLESKIELYCSPENYGNILRLHDHKIDYFIRTLKEVKAFFSSLVHDKYEIVGKFISKAKSNIEEYDKKTKIGTDRMINSWRTIDDKVNQIIDGSINQNNTILRMLNTPSNYLDLELMKEWYSDNLNKFNSFYRKVGESYKSTLYSRLSDIKEKLKQQLFKDIEAKRVLQYETAHKLLETEVSAKMKYGNLSSYDSTNLFRSINSQIFEFLTKSLYAELKKQVDSLKSRTKGLNPLDAIDKQILTAGEVLYEIFSSYKDVVKVYTVAAFSVEARDYIRKLGLSQELDQLDMQEPDVLKCTNEMEKEIFDSFLTSKIDFEKECTKIYNILHEIKLSQPTWSAEFDLALISNHESDVVEANNEKLSRFEDSMRKRVVEHFDAKVSKAQATLLTRIVEKDNELKRLRFQRIQAMWLLPVVFSIVFAVTLLIGFKTLGIAVDTTVLGRSVTVIIGSVLFWLGNFVVKLKRGKFSVKKHEIVSRFVQSERQIISNVVDEDFDSFRYSILNQILEEILNLKHREATSVLDGILSKQFNASNVTIFESLSDIEKLVKHCIINYSKALTRLYSALHEILINTEKSKQILLDQSMLIKKNSINPSFKLLLRTKEDLAKVQSKIESFDFV